MRRPPRHDTAEAHLITIYWRDIPAQVMARAGHDNARVCLSDRFQEAIDRAAEHAGKTDHDSYQGEWREERSPCSKDVEDVVDDATSRIERQFPNDVLDRRARNGGWAG
jgi:hypothetical protein